MMDQLNIIKNTLLNLRISSLVEILIVAWLLYKLYWLIRETRAEQLLKGILIILALLPISQITNMTMLYFLLSRTITVGVLSFVIIFQPEIRRALEHLGRTAFNDRHLAPEERALNDMVGEMVNAVESLSLTKTGALIAVEQQTMLREIIATGTLVDAQVSAPIIENIFFPNTPLHDGAMIIRGDRVLAAGCVLPLTNSNEISKKLGTRHRAAIGLTEVSDAAVIIVSEETGVISLALNGKLVRNYDGERLKAILLKILSKNKETAQETVREKVRKWLKTKPTTSS
ncbi:Diadenylate cyclase [Clostridiaceae bacterium JG1575]|nr:Diadenylate cyclase [Clostridiaceae bacterium JG1575]